jgi:anthranilate phosphoribosyltransferase
MALGGNLDLDAGEVAACIDEVGIGFLYAVNHHPAMRHAIGPRREIGQRTIFNVLGPLTNPAGATHQIIGVYDPALTGTIARVLGALESRAAYVVHGAGGLDELSLSGPNHLSRLRGGQVESLELDPQALGLPLAPVEALAGGSPEDNAEITRAILSGKERGPRRDVTLLNAAAVFSVEDGDWQRGLATAAESIDSGAALDVLERWIARTQRARRHAV